VGIPQRERVAHAESEYRCVAVGLAAGVALRVDEFARVLQTPGEECRDVEMRWDVSLHGCLCACCVGKVRNAKVSGGDITNALQKSNFKLDVLAMHRAGPWWRSGVEIVWKIAYGPGELHATFVATSLLLDCYNCSDKTGTRNLCRYRGGGGGVYYIFLLRSV
jgi:hypothetical protein